MSEKSYELPCKILAVVPEKIKNELESIFGRKFKRDTRENLSFFER